MKFKFSTVAVGFSGGDITKVNNKHQVTVIFFFSLSLYEGVAILYNGTGKVELYNP
jgi:hypothetical protein